LTLTGPGGTGKTRFALQLAADLLDAFPDGVWFVDLAPIRDPALVAATIATTLAVKEVGEHALLESLQAFVREKRLLLVLDNFEQIVTTAVLVADLLKVAPRLKVLVTSRIVLHLYGEQEYPVPPLDLPNLTQLPALAALGQYTSVALFSQRAQAVKPAFQVTHENAPAVAAICHRLDGLPLAIELAAARVKLFSPQALLARLDQRLKTLTGGAHDLPARQQTLRGAIDWSYDLLDAAEQTLFVRLGVFVGGCTLDAVAAVCAGAGDDPGAALDGLASLVDKSLVRQQEGTEGEPRFTLLETIREYALEQLAASGEAEALRRQHARYYVTWAGVRPGDRVVAEADNLRAALQWTLERGEVELGLPLLDALTVIGWFPETRRIRTLWHQAVRARLDTLPPVLRVQALIRLGIEAWSEQDFAVASAHLEEGLALARTLGDTVGIAAALHSLADVRRDQGEYARAEALYQESLPLHQALGDQRGSAWVYHTWGELALMEGDYARALALEQASVPLFRATGQQVGIAISLVNQGFAAQHQGDYAQAARFYRESLRLAQTVEGEWVIPVCLIGYAGVAAARGHDSTAGTAGAARAARLLGAVEGFYASSGAPMHYNARREYDRAVAAVHAQLDEAAFAAAWAEGRAMTLEQAITYALEETGNA
ncbi:MAG: tetratricopeptide repeat protein, partial [Chloroflexota bacterium]|nr:tetratricopeptide repeat protein [Chloroflexota bacterium]